MGEGDVHTEAGHQADNALRHREGFAIARRVGPGHGDLLTFQILQRTKVLAQPGEIGHGLRRVVDIALQIDQRRSLRQDALLVAVVQRFADFAHVGVARAKEHVIANADGVGAEGDHVGGFTDRFAVGNL